MMTTDAEALARVRAGDERAFTELVEKHRDRLWGVCLRVTGRHDDAQDALQDALLAAWRSIHQFRGESAVGTWLYRIAANSALRVVSKRREDLPGDLPDRPPPGGGGHESQVVDELRIAAALELVPYDFRVALVLREYGDFTYEQIAAHQGIGVQTVKSRLNRARATLRKALDDA